MGKVDELRRALRAAPDRDSFLLEHSDLPGPRANLELVAAAAEEGDAAAFRRWAALGPDRAPADAREVFLAVCGVVGLGRLAAEGDRAALAELRGHASDPRWRVREGVAMALQRLGAADLDGLLAEMEGWAAGGAPERRAVVAALCEPALLRDPAAVRRVLALLDRITDALPGMPDRRGADVRTLRKTLGYGWSVAVVALPEEGRPLLERIARSADPDLRWIARENLRKRRLVRLDDEWARHTLALVDAGAVVGDRP